MTRPGGEAGCVATDGVALAVHELGGDGATVLLAHATGLHGLVWTPLADLLSHPYRCVSLDARGHGDSGAPPGCDFSWDGLARDVLAVTDWLAPARPIGIGHSSGATALLLAEQAQPGTFAGIYCYEPIIVAADPPLGRDPDNWLAAAARRRRDVFSSKSEAYANYRSKPPFDSLTPAALLAYVEHGFAGETDVGLKCRPENEAVVHEMATAHHCYGRLGRVECPVLIATGDSGEVLSAGAADQLCARLPAASPEVIAGLGHLGPLEAPERVAESFIRFASSLDLCSGKPVRPLQ